MDIDMYKWLMAVQVPVPFSHLMLGLADVFVSSSLTRKCTDSTMSTNSLSTRNEPGQNPFILRKPDKHTRRLWGDTSALLNIKTHDLK